jgi:hypothetical protein
MLYSKTIKEKVSTNGLPLNIPVLSHIKIFKFSLIKYKTFAFKNFYLYITMIPEHENTSHSITKITNDIYKNLIFSRPELGKKNSFFTISFHQHIANKA